MKHTETVIIGGGQAGLAMSRCLVEKGVHHVILERGRLAERWRSERWDTLRLLSPNWHTRLPHWQYKGNDPDGFMTASEFTLMLEDYAASFKAPIESKTEVTRVERSRDGRFKVSTSKGVWSAKNVVVATGFCDVPRAPRFAKNLAKGITGLFPSDYRCPDQLAPGGVLIVGASATGLQIADELKDTGRDVTVAVGQYTRWPRTYRGKDVIHWIDAIGGFAAPVHPSQERSSPAPQLIGTPEHRELDLGTLQQKGIRLTGRMKGLKGSTARFAGDLRKTIETADAGMLDILGKIDGFIDKNKVAAGERDLPPLISVPEGPAKLDLKKEGISTVIWATGFERRYPWLKLPVLDRNGEIESDCGITKQDGLYVLGIRFQRTKGSNLIDGVGRDAEFLADHMAGNKSAKAA